MRSFTTRAGNFETSRLRTLVLAVGSRDGADDAVELLAGLPPLPIPLLVWAEQSAAAAVRAAGLDLGRIPSSGDPIHDATAWCLDPGVATQVIGDRFHVTPLGPGCDSFGRLCSSLRAAYGSRLLVVATDGTFADDVFVRLLVQRGGGLVRTDEGDLGVGTMHAPVPAILAHLGAGTPALASTGGLVS